MLSNVGGRWQILERGVGIPGGGLYEEAESCACLVWATCWTLETHPIVG